MIMQKSTVLLLLFLLVGFVQAQNPVKPSAILIKGGHVIDPKNNINEVMDVSIRDGKIIQVAKNIGVQKDMLVVDARGLYVTPGLIDMHAHHFPGAGRGDPPPDIITLRNGVTTAVDAGSSGWRSFPDFKKQTIDKSVTRILAFLNIGAEGYRRDEKGRANESDTSQMNSKLTADCALKNKQYIVGIKVAHFSGPDHLIPIDRGLEAARLAGIPFMLDDDLTDEFLKRFSPGDIYTHTFGQVIIDSVTHKVKPFILEARKRGIIFDVGFGGNNLHFDQAIPALKLGFPPNTMGTDLNYGSYNAAMKSLLNVMSTFMAMGMNLQDVIKAATWSPAQVIKHEELGHLSAGAVADVSVFNLMKGNFGFTDTRGFKLKGTQRLEAELTIRAGNIVWDLNGISKPAWVNK
jgi:dihydroorotase